METVKLETKVCTKCKVEKGLGEYHKNKTGRNGRRAYCKSCTQIKSVVRYQNNKESMLEASKIHYQNNKEVVTTRNKIYRQNNKESIAVKKKIHYQNNRESIIKRTVKNTSDRVKEDTNFRITSRLRARMNRAIKDNFKSGSAVTDLGCSVEFFKQYIAAQFAPSMGWDNWGNGPGKWQFDHVYPLSRLNMSKRDQFLMGAHYTNLRPMWAVDNIRKGDSMEEAAGRTWTGPERGWVPNSDLGSEVNVGLVAIVVGPELSSNQGSKL